MGHVVKEQAERKPGWLLCPELLGSPVKRAQPRGEPAATGCLRLEGTPSPLKGLRQQTEDRLKDLKVALLLLGE